MIGFRFGDIHTEGLTSRERHAVHCYLEADLSVVEDDRELYAEILFPVVELAAVLRRWQRTRGVFRFDTDQFAEADRWSVRFLPVDGGWQVVNDEAEPIASAVVPVEVLDAAVEDFVTRLRAACVAAVGDWVAAHFD